MLRRTLNAARSRSGSHARTMSRRASKTKCQSRSRTIKSACHKAYSPGNVDPCPSPNPRASGKASRFSDIQLLLCWPQMPEPGYGTLHWRKHSLCSLGTVDLVQGRTRLRDGFRFDRSEDAENYARKRLADSDEVEQFALLCRQPGKRDRVKMITRHDLNNP
jgi:hypothetical protein